MHVHTYSWHLVFCFQRALLRLGRSLGDTTMSTAFSGIGTPEVSMNLLHNRLQGILPNEKLNRPKML